MDWRGPSGPGCHVASIPREMLSPGQDGEIVRGNSASPHLRDNAFVPENLNDWLRSDHVGLRQVGTAHHPRSKAVGNAHH